MKALSFVVGVDASRAGWIGIVVGPNGFMGAEIAARFDDLIGRLDGVAAVGVDIPIGLPRRGHRVADAEARRFVGARRSSVFSVPPRSVVEASDYSEARQVAQGLGIGVSAQSYALSPKLLEVEAIARHDPRVFEVHPEVSFRAMASRSLPPKKTWNGQETRRHLLALGGIVIPADIGDGGQAAPDDVVDAGAAAWTARRKALGVASSLPDPPEQLDRRPTAIWY
ncbi:MAG: DUF429 domain-containing protein [Acidimicrobiia bacterium]